METTDKKLVQKLHIQEALLECADFLSCYTQLANAHPVDFIVQDLWNRVLPQNIQTELSALTAEELHQLPDGQTPNAFNFNRHKHPQTRSKEAGASASEITHSETSLPSDVDRLVLGTEEGSSLKEGLSSSKRQSTQWKQNSLCDFLIAVQEHCIEHFQCLKALERNFSSWLGEKDGKRSERAIFVHAFMKEKKMHEVEIMADMCTQIFNKCSADVVIDVGSGKGYLSTHLSLQSGLPVIGIDSQPHNTSGAMQRAGRLAQQWDSLVKFERKKESQKVKVSNPPQPVVKTEEKKYGIYNEDGSGHKATIPAGADPVDTSKSELGSGDARELMCNSLQGRDKSSNFIISHSQLAREKSKADQKQEFLDHAKQTRQSKSASRENQTDKIKLSNGMIGDGDENQTDKIKLSNGKIGDVDENHSNRSKGSCGKCVAVTTFVSPDTKLMELVRRSADRLGLDKACPDFALRSLLTGLHTCGPLAASMLRLFIQDNAVRAMCGVGCCYQLMQERFADESGGWRGAQASVDPDQGEGDFPLSIALLEKKMKIGRTALNMASLALPRMTRTDGELQGKTFYPRALLQAFIQKKLGYIPQDLKKLRKLAKQASSPPDYVIKAVQKLNISGCEASEEEVAVFHEQHRHQEDKMAAFFQLRATLAPVVETVILLDRLLFLLEQECVEEAFLVRLFDPVTSPRCHALIAVKKEHD